MTAKEREQTVARLPPNELARFHEWFLDFDSSQRDQQITDDASHGRLDRLADLAVADHRAGRTKPPCNIRILGEESVRFLVTIDRDEDGIWVIECPSIPGCVSQGQTKEEALTNIEDAIKTCLEVRSERGMPLTVETRQVEVTA